jgi:hypothetical protein
LNSKVSPLIVDRNAHDGGGSTFHQENVNALVCPDELGNTAASREASLSNIGKCKQVIKLPVIVQAM